MGSLKTFLFKNAIVMYNWSIINCTCVKCKIWWILTYVYTHESTSTAKIKNIFVTPKSFLVPLVTLSPSLTSSPSSGNCLSAYITIDKYLVSRTLYQWIIQYYSFLSGFFTQHHYFEIHPCCHMSIPSYCCVVLRYHCRNIIQLSTRWSIDGHLTCS